jgi:hypothetical protein
MTDRRTDPPGPDAPLIRTLAHDFPRVAAEFRNAGVGHTFRRTFAELEEFYLTTHAQTRLAAMGRVKRMLFLSVWLLKSLLLRLTPARRVLLGIALFSLVAGRVQFGSAVQVDLRMAPLGAFLLLLILMLELKDKLLAREELEAGRAVQDALLPAQSPAVPGWELWLHSESANEVGGDLVDFLALDAERFGVALGDVAGKGLPAALLMAKLQATLRALLPETVALGELGRRVNRILHRDGLPKRFATLVYLEIGADAGRVRWVNAGHMPPLILGRERIEETPRGGLALGLSADSTYFQQQVEIERGDLFIVYSDGVTEAMDEHGRLFDEERLRALLTTLAGRSAAEVGAAVLAAVAAFAGAAPHHDDLSLAVLRRRL